jgi:hypothetical protein
MAQFNRIKSEFGFDFAEHFISCGVPPGVPASGKGESSARNHPVILSRVKRSGTEVEESRRRSLSFSTGSLDSAALRSG